MHNTSPCDKRRQINKTQRLYYFCEVRDHSLPAIVNCPSTSLNIYSLRSLTLCFISLFSEKLMTNFFGSVADDDQELFKLNNQQPEESSSISIDCNFWSAVTSRCGYVAGSCWQYENVPADGAIAAYDEGEQLIENYLTDISLDSPIMSAGFHEASS